MSTLPKLSAANRPFAAVLVDSCARAAPLRNQNTAKFSGAVFRANESFVQGADFERHQ
jgi:hypothetical protein